ncbi:MAG: DUF4160 domain-containing protein [Flavobacteriales bacterium]|nr:DUF4160 domain-containing protein [Flavobacteriales bacterium]
MPTVLLREGFSFYFWSDEGSEPPHVHVSKGTGLAKWWLVSEPTAEYSNGFKKQEQRKIAQLIKEHHETLIQAWKNHFGPR